MTATATPRTPSDLAGSVALVTGAVGDLGRCMAQALAAAGAAVAVHHLGQPQQADALVEVLRGAGATAAAFEADVSDWDQVQELRAAITDVIGPVDVLINNAGVMERSAFAETSLDLWQRTLAVDLTGVFICCRAFAPAMSERGHGVVVNVSSQLAYKGAVDYAAYCAAKAGVLGLTRALARELGPAVRVNAIAPGPIDTAFIAPWKTPEWEAERTRDSVIGRLGTAEEVAPAVVFLASPGAALVHGQTIHLNGGGVLS